MHLHVLQGFDGRAHGARLGQGALGGLHQGRQAVEGLAARQAPFQLGGVLDALELFGVQRQLGMADLGIDGALHDGRNLAAFPRGQDVRKGPGDDGAQQGVGHALEEGERGVAAVAVGQHVGLDEAQRGAGHGGDEIAALGKAMGGPLGHRHDDEQHDAGRMQSQQAHGEQASHQGAGHALVAALQRLRQAASQHDGDGEQDPVVVQAAPGQVDGDGIAHAHGQRGADGVAHLRGLPAPDREEGCPRPGSGADEHLPVGPHDGQVGHLLAAGGA